MKEKMKKWKSNLDERQEQNLLQIEHNGCWLAFWGLLAAMIVQCFIYGSEIKYLAGEWMVFMLLSVYLSGACMKHGIWDRRLKPDAKTNGMMSLIAAFAAGMIGFGNAFRNYPDKIAGAAAAGVFMAVITFFLCFGVMSAFAWAYQKKKRELEEEPEEEDKI